MDSGANFLGEWARARGSDVPATRSVIERLKSLAERPRERILIAAVEIDAGQRAGDPMLVGSGIQRFRGGLHDEQLEVLRCFPDLAVLGAPHRRIELLHDVWVTELGRAHPAVAILRERTLPSTADLAQPAGWNSSLDGGLTQELKRQVAWVALDAYIETRGADWMHLLRSPALALRPDEAGYWEFELTRALAQLLSGSVADAAGAIRRLRQMHAGETWRLHAIRRAVTVYAPLAAPRLKEWFELCDVPVLTSSEVASPEEELGSFAAGVASGTWSDKSQSQALERLGARPAWLLCFLIQFSGEPFGSQIAAMLLELSKEPARFKALPWPSRVDAFIDACSALPTDVGFRLLAGAVEAVEDPRLTAAMVDALEQASASAMDQVPRRYLGDLLERNAPRLSVGTGMMLRRGIVYRAIVDGSNVVLAGVHGHDRPGSFAYYEQLLEDLSQAGFREFLTYFDAKLRHGFPPSEWQKIEALEARRHAMVVRGVADVKVIEDFMRHPDSSWIVTNDDYRDHLSHFEGFGQYWFSHRLHFHVGQDDRIAWDRPLDAAALPRGAPQRPSAQPSRRL